MQSIHNDQSVSSDSHSRDFPGSNSSCDDVRYLDEAISSEGQSSFKSQSDKIFDSCDGFCGKSLLESVKGYPCKRALTEGLPWVRKKLPEGLEHSPVLTRHQIFDRPESVCGNDDRVKIDLTIEAPWRWTCFLLSKRSDGSQMKCTGWFIGPRTVVTAGHCLFDERGWVDEVEVIPGGDGEVQPFGSQIGRSFRSVRGWVEQFHVDYDYGAIILPDNNLGNEVGWFGFASLSDQDLKHTLVNNAGYPGDKPGGTQWFGGGRLQEIQERRLFYMIDTAAGGSGSPVWQLENGIRRVIGIHAYGGCPNKATRITNSVFENLTQWNKLGS